MKIGASIGPVPEAAEDIPEEFDFVEIAIGEKEIQPREVDWESLEETMKEKDFELVIHLPFRQPLVTEAEELNDANIEYLERLILETKVEFEKAVVHVSWRDEDNEELEQMLEYQVEDLAEIARDHGVEIVFENVGQFRNPELFMVGDILDRLDLKMCFDTGHAFSEVGQEEMEEFLEEYSHVISHLHLQDTREGQDLHMSLGEGGVEFQPIADRLQDFNGTACIEIFAEDPEYFRISREKLLDWF